MKTLRPVGNCYVTCEALYHLLGGKKAGWTPMNMRHEGVSHWFLQRAIHQEVLTIHVPVILILDPTVSQFKTKPDYYQARGRGFLTRKPSKRARALMKILVWQD